MNPPAEVEFVHLYQRDSTPEFVSNLLSKYPYIPPLSTLRTLRAAADA